MPAPTLTLARAAGKLSRRLGRGGGTSLPGKVLLRMRPDAVGRLGAGLRHGTAVVSATNGKTTTARMISSCIAAAGWPLVANPAGANLLSGVATALLEGSARRPAPEVGLFEVDEAALPEVARQLRPRVVVLMNLFRDQLDRYGELEHLAERWAGMVADLGTISHVVVNADDPAVAALAEGRTRVTTFGVDDPSLALPALPHAADSTRCRRCSARLDYALVLLGHLGHWSCPNCGLRRPEPEVRATEVRLDGVRGISVVIATPEGEVRADLPLPGLHNAYNATAAVAGARALGVPHELIGPALARSAAAFGRAERVADRRARAGGAAGEEPGRRRTRTCARSCSTREPLHLLAALNDRTADGRDVSWIWDVDYEPLLPRIAHLTVSGDRAHDLALRFRYAGPGPGADDRRAGPRPGARRRPGRRAGRRRGLRPAHLHGDARAARAAGAPGGRG